jgi:hypothetical protein
MTPLGTAVYDLLCLRPGLDDPRITYKELARALREGFEEFEFITQRSQQLYRALDEVANECKRQKLPSLAALVVRADTRRPGDAYFEGTSQGLPLKGERIAAWRRELEAVKQTVYPSRTSAGER